VQRWGASGWERRNIEPHAEQRWGPPDWQRRGNEPYTEQQIGDVGLEPSRRPILPATKPAIVTAATTAFPRS
jgi:hypothetical protein